jgi:3-oxoacyl-[acyl-carrier protein] reductase
MASEGATVAACARDANALDDVVTSAHAIGAGEVFGVVADVTETEAASAVLRAVMERCEGVDILVNNAGGGAPKKLLRTTSQEWLDGFELNFFSAVRFSLACIPGMQARGWGRIVNVASTSARMPDPYFGIYSAAKAALVNFSKTVGNTFARDGIRCNCVLPGITMTDWTAQNIADAQRATGQSADEVMRRMLEKAPIPVGRLGEPDEVAMAVAFLASEATSWITGSSLMVDGGTLAVIP